MSPGYGLTTNGVMGNCISCQSRATSEPPTRTNLSALPKNQSRLPIRRSHGASIDRIVAHVPHYVKGAVLEKYPVPNKLRAVTSEMAGGDAHSEESSQIPRSKLRPPSAGRTSSRPASMTFLKSIDSNGNVPVNNAANASITSAASAEKPPSNNITARSAVSSVPAGNPTAVSVSEGNTGANLAKSTRPSSLPRLKLAFEPASKHTSILSNPDTRSPSLTMSPSSIKSNLSHSMHDSGIGSATQSPLLAGDKPKPASASKFGFQNRKKNTFDQTDSSTCAQQQQDRPTVKLNSAKDATKLVQTLCYSQNMNRAQSKSYVNSAMKHQYPSTGVSFSPCKLVMKTTNKYVSQRKPEEVTDCVTLMRNRAAVVLKQSAPLRWKPIEAKPKMSLEAIAADLESEIRQRLTADGRSSVNDTDDARVEVVNSPEHKLTTKVDLGNLLSAKNMIFESPTFEFITDISPIETPSSICTSFNSPVVADGGRCTSNLSHGDEEDSSAATSISDALIDDEIADQPGLLILGQSMSVPSSPTHWRSDLFDCRIPAMSLASCHSLPSEEDDFSFDSSTRGPRLLRRRVASVNDFGGEVKERTRDPVGMRTELVSPWQETVVVDASEYNAMAHELADVKAKLVGLQDLLMELPDDDQQCLNEEVNPVWDLKRDIVLLREELQEKNLIIRTLKNELRTAGKNHKCTCEVKRITCCNVATQTDRPRILTQGNGLSPSAEDIQLVSSKLKKTIHSAMPLRSRLVNVTANR